MADTVPTRPPRELRFERRMTDAEALMWNVEKDPWLNPNGGAISVLDRPLDVDHFRAQMAAAVVAIPRLMERVVGGFGRFGPPMWRPDPEFDLDYHVRVISLPPPGALRQLLDVCTDLYQDPFDRTRPLWLMYVIEGLEGGRGAVFQKLHHAVADGTGAARMAELWIQPTRQAPVPPDVDLGATLAAAVEADSIENGRPSIAESVLGTATHFARRQAGISRRLAGEMALWGADPLRARDLLNSAAKTVGQVRSQLLGGGGQPDQLDDDEAPQLPGGSPLWRTRSRHRHLEVLQFPLDRALAAAKALGGTLNDLFLAGIVNGAVAYHDERGVPLRTLNTSFVVSTRADKAIGGNSFTPSRFSAPAGPMDPLDRFKALSASMAEKRSQVSGGGLLNGLAGVVNLLPTSLVTSVARSQAANMDFATSNLRSSKRPFYMSGARVEDAYAFGPLAGTAFNLTAISYAGTFSMGLFMDPVAIDEPASLRDHAEEAYEELLDLGTS